MLKILIAVFVAQLLLFGYYTQSVADEVSFRCTVHQVFDLSSNGDLVKSKNQTLMNATFSIDRTTGNIIGNVFNNEGDYKTKVIDSGSKGSFKVFSFAERRGIAESLAVETRHDGKEKPFIGVDYLQTVIVGTCN